MSFARIPFPSLDWQPGAHPLERKKTLDGKQVVLLEFAPGFEDPNWCERGHIIYVVEGSFGLILRDRLERMETGEACVLEQGTPHRAMNPGTRPVRLIVIAR